MNEGTEKLQKSANEMLEELQRARDEARVQLHLGGMEAKEKFAGLETKLDKFEARAHAVGDDAADELIEGFGHLREAFHKLRENLKKG